MAAAQTAQTYRKDAQARQDLAQQNEELKAQLLELQKYLGGQDLLQHCKGLEKQLARKQKKVSALEAINESLRQQLAAYCGTRTLLSKCFGSCVLMPDACKQLLIPFLWFDVLGPKLRVLVASCQLLNTITEINFCL